MTPGHAIIYGFEANEAIVDVVPVFPHLLQDLRHDKDLISG